MADQDLIDRIEKALAEIRPYLNGDGGDIEMVSVDKDIVKVRLLGNCAHCHVNKMTLKLGVEMTIKKYAPEISEVINIDLPELEKS